MNTQYLNSFVTSVTCGSDTLVILPDAAVVGNGYTATITMLPSCSSIVVQPVGTQHINNVAGLYVNNKGITLNDRILNLSVSSPNWSISAADESSALNTNTLTISPTATEVGLTVNQAVAGSVSVININQGTGSPTGSCLTINGNNTGVGHLLNINYFGGGFGDCIDVNNALVSIGTNGGVVIGNQFSNSGLYFQGGGTNTFNPLNNGLMQLGNSSNAYASIYLAPTANNLTNLTLVQSSSPTVNTFSVNSHSGSGGDLLNIDHYGVLNNVGQQTVDGFGDTITLGQNHGTTAAITITGGTGGVHIADFNQHGGSGGNGVYIDQFGSIVQEQFASYSGGAGFFQPAGTSIGLTVTGDAHGSDIAQFNIYAGGAESGAYVNSSGAFICQGIYSNAAQIRAGGASVIGDLSLNTGGFVAITPNTAPSTPASGWVIYVDSGDSNKLKAKASTGTIVTLGTP